MAKTGFFERQIVSVKEKKVLMEENKKLLYQLTEQEIDKIEGRDFAIYKVLKKRKLHSDFKPMKWYEIGQWGRFVTEVPENFLEPSEENIEFISANELK